MTEKHEVFIWLKKISKISFEKGLEVGLHLEWSNPTYLPLTTKWRSLPSRQSSGKLQFSLLATLKLLYLNYYDLYEFSQVITTWNSTCLLSNNTSHQYALILNKM